MPIRIAQQRITTSRNGARVVLLPGDAFDFTDEEIAALDSAATRAPMVERVVEVPVAAEPPPVPPAPRRRGQDKEEAL